MPFNQHARLESSQALLRRNVFYLRQIDSSMLIDWIEQKIIEPGVVRKNEQPLAI